MRPADRALLTDSRQIILGLIHCLHSEAKGARHLHTGRALGAAEVLRERLDLAHVTWPTPTGEQPLLKVLRAVIRNLTNTLQRERADTSDGTAPAVIGEAVYAVHRIERLTDGP